MRSSHYMENECRNLFVTQVHESSGQHRLQELRLHSLIQTTHSVPLNNRCHDLNHRLLFRLFGAILSIKLLLIHKNHIKFQ